MTYPEARIPDAAGGGNEGVEEGLYLIPGGLVAPRPPGPAAAHLAQHTARHAVHPATAVAWQEKQLL